MFTKNKAEGNPNSLCNTSNTYNRLEGPWLSSVDQTSQEEWGHAPFHLQCFCCHHQTTHNTAQPSSITETTTIIIIIRPLGTRLSPAPSLKQPSSSSSSSSSSSDHAFQPSSITETTIIIIIIIRPCISALLHHWNGHCHHQHHPHQTHNLSPAPSQKWSLSSSTSSSSNTQPQPCSITEMVIISIIIRPHRTQPSPVPPLKRPSVSHCHHQTTLNSTQPCSITVSANAAVIFIIRPQWTQLSPVPSLKQPMQFSSSSDHTPTHAHTHARKHTHTHTHTHARTHTHSIHTHVQTTHKHWKTTGAVVAAVTSASKVLTNDRKVAVFDSDSAPGESTQYTLTAWAVVWFPASWLPDI